MILRRLTQRLAQHKDVAAEDPFFTNVSGQISLHQVVFRDDLLPVAEQDQKDLKGFSRAGHLTPAFKQAFSSWDHLLIDCSFSLRPTLTAIIYHLACTVFFVH